MVLALGLLKQECHKGSVFFLKKICKRNYMEKTPKISAIKHVNVSTRVPTNGNGELTGRRLLLQYLGQLQMQV